MLDFPRMLDFEPVGRGFESLRAHHKRVSLRKCRQILYPPGLGEAVIVLDSNVGRLADESNLVPSSHVLLLDDMGCRCRIRGARSPRVWISVHRLDSGIRRLYRPWVPF